MWKDKIVEEIRKYRDEYARNLIMICTQFARI